MPTLLEKLAPKLVELVARKGMRTVHESYDASAFGNAVAESASKEFDLRVVRDRGQIAIELSPSGKADWHNVRDILSFINRQPCVGDPGALAEAFAAQYDQVAALLTSDLDRVGFTEFKKNRSAAFLKSMFPSAT